MAALSQEVFGTVIALPDFKTTKSLTGIGMSDADTYAIPLSRKFSYHNTYYHREPRLDITSIGNDVPAAVDFIISSDVFEHIPPPVEIGFGNLYRILNAGGVCIFSVPYTNTGETEEHFPDLFDYRIVTRNRKKVLINRTRDGHVESFEHLRFHGGPGLALEMRVFSKPSLVAQIERAGFTGIEWCQQSIPEHGILIDEDTSSVVVVMRKGTPPRPAVSV